MTRRIVEAGDFPGGRPQTGEDPVKADRETADGM
jgi:hypothetical protein